MPLSLTWATAESVKRNAIAHAGWRNRCSCRKSHFDEEELTALFNELTDHPKALTLAFENSYYLWLEYMYVTFITHLDIPEYDHQANEVLTNIIHAI